MTPILGVILPLLLSFVSLKLPLLLLDFCLGRPPGKVKPHSIISRSAEVLGGTPRLSLFVELPIGFKPAPFDLLVDLSHLLLEIDVRGLSKVVLSQS